MRVLGDMWVFRVNENTIDVFTDIGWDNWSRFTRTTHPDTGKPILARVKGKLITSEQYSQLTRVV